MGEDPAFSISAILRKYPLPFFALSGLIVGSILYVVPSLTSIGEYVWYGTLIIGGIPIIISTSRKMLGGKLAVDIIALLAIITAVIMDEAFAGVVIILMQSGGEAIENYGMARATTDLRKLLEKRPKLAHLKMDGTILDIGAAEVIPGNILLVKQGELFPVDGTVISGETEADESSITGEARLIRKTGGEQVLSGTVNVAYAIEMEASKTADESEFARIVELVRRAQEDRAPIQRVADRYGVWLIPLTLITAFAGWLITGNTVTILSVLVVATPCPLILATPVAMMGGLSKSTKRGIIVKGGSAIESLGNADEMFFDKTGTLTKGTPEVKRVIPLSDYSEDELLFLIGSAEQFSGHPVALEISSLARRKYGKLPLPESFEEIPGRGVIARVDGKDIAVGTFSMCKETVKRNGSYDFMLLRKQISMEESMSSCIVINNEIAGVVLFSDTMRIGVPEMIRHLKQIGVKRTVMLTGDNAYNAEKVAEQAGVDEFRFELKPKDKLEYIAQEVRNGKTVVMVGDGINDAPALATASVGIAMGVKGSDISAETSEVILTVDDVTRVGDAVSIGRRTLTVAKQSIFLGMGLSAVFMLFASLGYIYPAEGALIQEVIDIIAIVNSLRAAF